jgi:CheY-like chemotaxis protein
MLNPSRHQVLIVEDDAAVRTTLSLLLKASGYEVTTATNGVEALALLKMRLPAVVLSDLNMPEMSGFELFSEVRQQFPKVSLVAMSGAYQTEDAIPGGVIADAFYAKGHGNVRGLLRIISEMTSQSESRIH